jgi:ABC-2 type transport system ATP-binding protein
MNNDPPSPAQHTTPTAPPAASTGVTPEVFAPATVATPVQTTASLPATTAVVAPNVSAPTTNVLPDATINAIEVKNLCKSFGTVQAVNDISLTIPAGTIFGLLGPNGSGKTTIINMISGLSTQTSGDIRIMGYDIKRNARKVHQLLGSVAQETALYEELSAWHNMDFHASLFGIRGKDKKERIVRLLDMVQLLDHKDSVVKTFSGGMKRRLAIARALLHDPQLLYLDEPTLGVDVQARRAIWDYLLALRRQGKTVLITTNYLEEAQELCDDLAIIDHGKLVIHDTMKHIQEVYGGGVIEVDTMNITDDWLQLKSLPNVIAVSQEINHVKVQTQGGDNLVMQVVYILSRRAGIAKITFRSLNLDEIFLNLTGSALRD